MKPHQKSKKRSWRDRKRRNRMQRRPIVLKPEKYRFFISIPQTEGKFREVEISPPINSNPFDDIVYAVGQPLPVFKSALDRYAAGRPAEYPPNDWMCGFAPHGQSFSPSCMQQIPPGPLKSDVSLGLGMLDVFMTHDPAPRFYGREKLLEEECLRHFPNANAASVAAYVGHSIKMAEQKKDNETPPSEQEKA